MYHKQGTDNLKDICIVNTLGKQRMYCLPLGAKGRFSYSLRKQGWYEPLQQWQARLASGRTKITPPSRAKGWHAYCPLWKILALSAQGFFPVTHPTVCYSCHLALFVLSCGRWISGNKHKNADPLATATAVLHLWSRGLTFSTSILDTVAA